MSTHLIALAGFAAHEHSAIESLLRTAAARGLDCRLTNAIGEAALILGDGDNSGVIRLLRARPARQQVLLIGRSDGGTGWPLLPRRFRLDQLVQAVSERFRAASAAQSPRPRGPAFARTEPFAPLSATPSPPQAAFAPTEPFAPLAPQSSPLLRPAFAATEPFAPLQAAPAAAFAATEPFAPLGSFQATEPFAPLDGAARTPERPRSAANRAPYEAITAQSLAAWRRPSVGAAPASASSSGFLGLGEAQQTGGLRQSLPVLIVDDSEMGQRQLQRELRELGVPFESSRHAEEALRRLAKQRFSHVFVDAMMSGMAGLKVCRAIKRLALAAEHMPKVVLVTHMGGTADRTRGLLAGCDAYLLKPLRSEDLNQILSTASSTEAGNRTA